MAANVEFEALWTYCETLQIVSRTADPEQVWKTNESVSQNPLSEESKASFRRLSEARANAFVLKLLKDSKTCQTRGNLVHRVSRHTKSRTNGSATKCTTQVDK